MKPGIVIPTYWSYSDRFGDPGSPVCYDHAIPIDVEHAQLEDCVASLEQVAGLDRATVVVLVVAPPTIEERAVHRVHEICSRHNLPDVVVVDSFKALSIADMFQDELPAGSGEPVSLRGYGAIRNMGLVACCALGCDMAVFLDDDEVVLDPEFLANAVYGIGMQPRQGAPILAKSGYFRDHRNSALADRRKAKPCDKHWAKRAEFNEWMTQALAGPRISRSNTLCGGCFAVHAEAFTRVAFDPWITRGEDLDYFLNLKFYGIDTWFDNRWCVSHNPPRVKDTAFRFLQDVYRWTYERRKIEVCNSNIDYRTILPEQLMPYPGPWIGPELPARIRKTALLRAQMTSEHGAYWKIYTRGRKDAVGYAEENCTRYMRFQEHWSAITSRSWQNEAMQRLLRGEGMLNAAIASRMAERNRGAAVPVVASDTGFDDPSGSDAAGMGGPTWDDGQAGQYPEGQYPDSQYPDSQYPDGQYAEQYPDGQHPDGQYAGQYLEGQYPDGQQHAPYPGQGQGFGEVPQAMAEEMQAAMAAEGMLDEQAPYSQPQWSAEGAQANPGQPQQRPAQGPTGA